MGLFNYSSKKPDAECTTCHDRGEIICTTCGGSGKIRDSHSHSPGKDSSYDNCPSCTNGHQPCPDC